MTAQRIAITIDTGPDMSASSFFAAGCKPKHATVVTSV
jgi:hypothetical protein